MVLVAVHLETGILNNLGSKFSYNFRDIYNRHVNYDSKGSENT